MLVFLAVNMSLANLIPFSTFSGRPGCRPTSLEVLLVVGDLARDGGAGIGHELAVVVPLHHAVDQQRNQHAGRDGDELEGT